MSSGTPARASRWCRPQRRRCPPACTAASTSRALDYFPDPIYLAVLDDGVAAGRRVAAATASCGTTSSGARPTAVGVPAMRRRACSIVDGDGQHVILAVRVPVDVPASGTGDAALRVRLRPRRRHPDAAVAELRARARQLLRRHRRGWKQRLVWAAFPAWRTPALVQREIAWAVVQHARQHHLRRVPQRARSSARAARTSTSTASTARWATSRCSPRRCCCVDPQIAADTLTYALATQLGPAQSTPWRFPYATTGVGAYQ